MLGFEIVSTSPNLGADDKFHWCTLRLCNSEVMLNTAYEFVTNVPCRAVDGVASGLYRRSSVISLSHE